jgi:ribonuclease G
MEAAFVDIGLEKNGFLYVNEIVVPELDEAERRRKPIQDLIKPGQELLVQVVKDPMGTKGARLTMEVSLAGRFMVLAPGGEGVGVSKRLSDEERQRLRDLVKNVQTDEGAGLIVRTAAEGAEVVELERDVRLLEKLWETTRGAAERATAPALVYQEPDLSIQMIRDDLRPEVSEVVIDDERQHARVSAYVHRTSPELLDRVKLYRGKKPLFSRYEIDEGIRSTLKRRVDLPSGGSLIFDYAEAFTIVDVNTGRFTGKKRLEDTILKTNLEAAVEVVRQLRLRDVGGIIVVDFIDMASQKNRDAVLEALQKELEKDRTKVYLVEISPLGLVEMTRQNVADGVREILTTTCDCCSGTGRVLSDESIGIDHMRALRRHAKESKAEAFVAAMHPSVAAIMIGPGGSKLRELERETGRLFSFEGDEGVARDFLEIRAEGSRDEIERQLVPVTEGDEIEVLIEEPHMYVETDAIGRLESGYVVVVTGSAPYLGETHRVRIDRATRTAAYATLLDAEPMTPVEEPADRESDILEPTRRVGERVDVEGRVRRQQKRAAQERRRDQARDRRNGRRADTGGRDRTPDRGEGEPSGDGDSSRNVVSGAEITQAQAASEGRRRRRGRRGGRGRNRSRAGTTPVEAAAETAETAGEAGDTSTAAPGLSRSARRRQRRRRAAASGNGHVAAPAADDVTARKTPPTPERARTPEPEPVAEKKGLLGRILGRH